MPEVSSGTRQLGGTWVTHPWVETGRTAVGFGIVNGPRGDLAALKEFVLQVEELGLDGFWVTDHPVWYPDSLITLAAVAGALATSVFVEALLQRGGQGDFEDARAAIDRLAAVPTDPGFVLNEITLLRLRALLARAHGDETEYRDCRDRYRNMARTLGFEGHMKWAEAMP